VLLDDEGPRLAPLYDVLCTACSTGLSRRSAQRIGGLDRADHVAERHWERMAEEAGLGGAAARRRRRALAQRAADLAPGVAERYPESGWGRPVLKRVAETVARRASRLADTLTAPARGGRTPRAR
jgi:serine/threonine-protein kinase HipA